MSTEKFVHEKTVKIETSKDSVKVTEDLAKFLPKPSIKQKWTFKIFVYLFILVIALLSLIKVPYCGSYTDAYFFEFIFGSLKFLVYLFLILFSIAGFLNVKWLNFFTSKRFIVGWSLLTLACIIGVSTIYELCDGSNDTSSFNSFLQFGKLIKEYIYGWGDGKLGFNSLVSKYINHITPYVWQFSIGIIGNILIDLWGILITVILIIIALVLILIAFLYLTNLTKNKHIVAFKQWIIKHIVKNLNKQAVHELDVNHGDTKPDFLQKSEIKQEAIQNISPTPPISFLSETGVDNYLTNKVRAKELSDIITNFLQRFDSIIQLQKIVVMPLFSEITYDVEKPNVINNIFAMQNDLLQQLKIKYFNISYKGNIIRFEIPNQTPSKVSLKSVYNNMKNIPTNEIVVGVNENLNPLLVNLNKHRNVALIGTKGSGVSMLMVSMIVSLAYTNSPKNFNLVILSSTNDKTLKHLEKLPHLLFPIKYESIEITNSLIELQHEINYREELFKKNKVSSIDAYNNVKKNTIDYLKRIATFIIGFNMISKISLENSELLIDLLKRGSKVGISIILLTNSVDSELLKEDLYRYLDIKIIMKLEFEQESIQLLDSKRGAELFGNGDGYCFDKLATKYTRFQACYMNIEELLEIIKIIDTFYSVKTKLN